MVETGLELRGYEGKRPKSGRDRVYRAAKDCFLLRDYSSTQPRLPDNRLVGVKTHSNNDPGHAVAVVTCSANIMYVRVAPRRRLQLGVFGASSCRPALSNMSR